MTLKYSKRTRKLLVLSGVIGPVLFFTLLSILGLVWMGYNPISTGMSEIGAVDSPFKNIMNIFGFSLLGVFIVIFSTGFKIFFRKNLQMAFTFILLLIGGIFMFLVGFFPCDPQCIDVTLTGRLHSFTATIPAISIPLAAMVSAYPISKNWNKNWGYLSFILGILSIAAGPLMFLEVMDNFTGLIQRLGIAISLLWIFIVSIKIYKETR
ncbi:MAG: DUF998 domain-containing protein [Promethearchaeota archaeon]